MSRWKGKRREECRSNPTARNKKATYMTCGLVLAGGTCTTGDAAKARTPTKFLDVGQIPRQWQRNDVDNAELPPSFEPFEPRGPIERTLDKASNGRRW